MGKIDHANFIQGLTMNAQDTFSPISLRYIAALRGNKAKKTGTEFTYAEVFCRTPEKLTCLAASNPEGRFYGFVVDDAARRDAENQAAERGIFNVVFLAGSPSQILARLSNGSMLPPMLDYLCCDESGEELGAAEHAALFDLAQHRLNADGLFVRAYRAYENTDGALKFLVQELAPEMNIDQKLDFLSEIKKLGALYFAKNPDMGARLDKAIAAKAPQDFFAYFDGTPATSGAFDMLVAMGARGLSYAGDAKLASNYVELAVPAEAQDLIVTCRNNPLYEPIKDFALDRSIRRDIWIKEPSHRSTSPTELFGGFAYGILSPREQIPLAFAAQGKKIDLSSALYLKLIDLMSLIPLGVGDVLAHPSGAGERPEKILEALQILVACGYARPMRGSLTATRTGSSAQPRLVGSFNRYLDKIHLSGEDVWFSSQVLGCGVTLPASEAFVMQALNRAGLDNSVSALMPELERISHTAASHTVLKAEEVTPELARELVLSAVGKSLPQWYAYALLEAA